MVNSKDTLLTLIILILTTTSLTDTEILDYTKNHIITINDGQAKIQEGTFKIIHLIDLDQYDYFLKDILTYLDKNIPINNLFYPILKSQIDISLEILSNIRPKKEFRTKRAINALGTVWKYIAGTPDHEDFEILNNDLNELKKNNNEQVIINEAFNERINNLTKLGNQLLNSIRKDNYVISEITLNLESRIRIIKEELINIKYAIQWAKIGIMNTILLNKKEIEIAIMKLKEERMPFASVEEALEYAKVNVITKESRILYLVKIPLTNNITYKNIIIRPVKRNKEITKLDFEEILKNKNEIYGIKNKCMKYNEIKICERNNIINISNSTCIPQILNSRKSFCTISNNQHVPTIEEIQPGIILLNDFNGTLKTEKEQRTITGTYLIKFHNTSLSINNETFTNIEMSTLTAEPAIIQPTPLERERINILSLEALNELHINNTKKINLLRTDSTINKSAMLGLAIIFTAIIITFKFWIKPTSKIIIQEVPTEPFKLVDLRTSTLPNLPDASIKTNNNQLGNVVSYSNLRLHDLPYF